MQEILATQVWSWFGMIPWRRAWQPTPVFLPREPHGQRNLAGCSPPGHKELDMTEHTCTSTHAKPLVSLRALRMGNTCIPVADSFWYLAKLIQLYKIKKKKKVHHGLISISITREVSSFSSYFDLICEILSENVFCFHSAKPCPSDL